MTNPAQLSGPRHLDSLILTPNHRPLIGTLQKRMPTLIRQLAERQLIKTPGRYA